jgi:hypothetical protein
VPIRRIDWTSGEDVKRHESMVSLVDNVHSLQLQLSAARMTTDRDGATRQLDDILQRLDSFVYDLYGLTDDEIALVEENTPSS